MKNIAVVGAGIVGICCAYFLKKSGLSVTLIDREDPGTMTSFGHACSFADYANVPVNYPGLIWDIPKLLLKKDGPLATLTGAIIVSLGSEYAGLFSNNDNLSKQLIAAGKKVEEKLWRMPLNENFDKLINSKNADMQNINYVGGAGSTTAAQFLQRFVINKTPWAHLDIAGMAFSKYAGALNSGGATGYGVRLLNKFVEEYYE